MDDDEKGRLLRRLEREGRLRPARTFQSETMRKLKFDGKDEDAAEAESWELVANHFPPLGTDIRKGQRYKVLTDRVKELEPNAPRIEEDDWIAAHPLMLAVTKPGENIALKLADIDPPHGACPSQACAGWLQFCVNEKSHFWKERAKQKAARGADPPPSPKKEIPDPTGDMIEKMLVAVAV